MQFLDCLTMSDSRLVLVLKYDKIVVRELLQASSQLVESLYLIMERSIRCVFS